MIANRFLHKTRPFTLLLLLFCWSQLQASSVFILHSYSQEYNWTQGQHNGFVQHLTSGHPHDLLISTEHLDTKRRNYDADYAQEMYRHFKVKYTGYKPDAIYV
ncbi:MAG TPA: hypothetical protein VIQ03_04410, partial [Gammaproteobacteria bacterium]